MACVLAVGMDGVGICGMEVGREVRGGRGPAAPGRVLVVLVPMVGVVVVLMLSVLVLSVLVRLRHGVVSLVDPGMLVPAVLVHW